MGKRYQVLARRYRPQRFADVIGQEAVLTTLKNALRFDQAAHAYLFCGSRGVGKTTLARLFAKALNCPNRGPDLEPCNQCPSCIEITSGQSLDVMEIDGASNRGIDDIRQINETVGYAPSHGKYKIYIIDEVHMLTKEAFNALLKTLEEPPERAKFFFATTEPHKVLPTIVSRCQRFDLLRIGPVQIADKLAQIARDMNREVETEALHLIASFADGSLRDAESLFDQILCFASSDAIRAETVRQALGLISQEHFFDLDRAFSECRLAYAFELVEILFQAGKDLSHFLEQLVEHYRRLCLCKTLGEKALPLHLTERYAAASRHYTQSQCLYILDTLIAAEQTMQKSPFPRVTLESTLLHVIRSKNRIPIEAIARRLIELEQTLKIAPQIEAPQETDEEPKAELKPVPFNPYDSQEKPVPTPKATFPAPSAFEPAPSQAPSVFAATAAEPLPSDSAPEEPSVKAPSVFEAAPPAPTPCPAPSALAEMPAPTPPRAAPSALAEMPSPAPQRAATAPSAFAEPPAPITPRTAPALSALAEMPSPAPQRAAPAPSAFADTPAPMPLRTAPAPSALTEMPAPAPQHAAPAPSAFTEPPAPMTPRAAPAPSALTEMPAPAPQRAAPAPSAFAETPAPTPPRAAPAPTASNTAPRADDIPTPRPATAPAEMNKQRASQDQPPKGASSAAPVSQKHPSHYETLMRFAAVELEGTLKT